MLLQSGQQINAFKLIKNAKRPGNEVELLSKKLFILDVHFVRKIEKYKQKVREIWSFHEILLDGYSNKNQHKTKFFGAFRVSTPIFNLKMGVDTRNAPKNFVFL